MVTTGDQFSPILVGGHAHSYTITNLPNLAYRKSFCSGWLVFRCFKLSRWRWEYGRIELPINQLLVYDNLGLTPI